MAWNKLLLSTALIFLIFSSACSLMGNSVTGIGAEQDSTAAINTRAAEIVSTRFAEQTVIANAVASTLNAMVTDTPEQTFTPSITKTPLFTFTHAFTPTSKSPMLSVTVQTNCRSGPGTILDVLGILDVGQAAQVAGRNVETDNWIIKLPSNPAVTCWVWGKYAKVVGNTTRLPNIVPPPTPTPRASPTQAPGFQLTYDSAPYCSGWDEWRIFVKIVNSGGLTWKSDQLTETDGNTHLTSTVNGNIFMSHSKCGGGGYSDNLGPGESVIISASHFDDNPFGHNFSATLKVCSGEGMAGSCLTKTITFIP
jgi:hypothetical protein